MKLHRPILQLGLGNFFSRRAMLEFAIITWEMAPHAVPRSQRPGWQRINSLFLKNSTKGHWLDPENHDEFWATILPESTTKLFDKSKFGNFITFFPSSVGLVGKRPKLGNSEKVKPLVATNPDLLNGVKHVAVFDPGNDIQGLVLPKRNIDQGILENSNHLKHGDLVKKNARKTGQLQLSNSNQQQDTKSLPEANSIPARKRKRKRKQNRSLKQKGKGPNGRLSKCQKRNRYKPHRTGGMFDFARLSPERKDMEYSFHSKLSQYKDESWQYQTEDKAPDQVSSGNGTQYQH
ncbi:hypothetical protein HDU76_013560 [Blyttiomyces sp. JEL0837]|nr:hypothetical protein HDU76_013560 [Blyttiomyces sp. JEL0837]